MNKQPNFFIINGTPGCGKSQLAISIAHAAELNYERCNIGSCDNAIMFTGTPRNYDNANPGAFFRKIKRVGLSGCIILEEFDKLTDDACRSFFIEMMGSGSYYNEFTELEMDISDMTFIATSNNLKNVPSALRSRATIIQMEDYTDEELSKIAYKFIGECEEEYGLQGHVTIDNEVLTYITKELSDKNSIRDIKKYIGQIFTSIVGREECEFHITMDNLAEYITELQDIEAIKQEYVTEISKIKKKFRLCRKFYTDAIKERIREMLDVEADGTQEEKAYAISVLSRLVNTFYVDVPAIDATVLSDALHRSHYGMERAVKCIVRSLATYKYASGKLPVFLLDGPPGVGKTTIAETIAKAVNLPLIKISLNNNNDVDSFSGFVRSYKDAKPGILADALTKPGAGSYTAVCLVDEIEKAGEQVQNTLLSIFDGSETFYDKYLEIGIPVDRILFICTSNEKRKVVPTLLDRMEVVNLSGYSLKEKREIAENYVVPKAIDNYHLLGKVIFTRDAVRTLVADYSVTMGVRDAQRHVNTILEELLLTAQLNDDKPTLFVDGNMVRSILEKPVAVDVNTKTGVGEAMGLAVCGNVGECTLIQCGKAFSDNELEITGLVKGSAAESVKVAMHVVSNMLGRKVSTPLHVHMGNSGVDKDGPSGGLAFAAALFSKETGNVWSECAFTGELNISGQVLPVGGVHEKVVAAERAGIKRVFVPRYNYDRLRRDAFENIEIIPIEHVNELLKYIVVNEVSNETSEDVANAGAARSVWCVVK